MPSELLDMPFVESVCGPTSSIKSAVELTGGPNTGGASKRAL